MLQSRVAGCASHAAFHCGQEFLIEKLGIALSGGLNSLARVLADNLRGFSLTEVESEYRKSVVLQEVKQGLFRWNKRRVVRVQDIGQALAGSSGRKRAVPLVPLLPVLKGWKIIDIPVDSLLEFISRGQSG